MEKEKIILNEINAIFNTIIGKEIELNFTMQKSQISEWDSLFHLSLIVELESKYDISFTTEEIENLDSIKKIINKINI